MPWDSDIDVQISAESVHFLANYYNMTIYSYKKRDYMLEINPKYIDGSFGDYLNVIDARWIDTVTGVFIDITAARPYEGHEGILASKDMHKVKVWLAEAWHKRDLEDRQLILIPRRPISTP